MRRMATLTTEGTIPSCTMQRRLMVAIPLLQGICRVPGPEACKVPLASPSENQAMLVQRACESRAQPVKPHRPKAIIDDLCLMPCEGPCPITASLRPVLQLLQAVFECHPQGEHHGRVTLLLQASQAGVRRDLQSSH